MTKTNNASANPLLREAVKSPDACIELFRRDEEGQLAIAVRDILRHLKRSEKSTSLDLSQAELACGEALWDAITKFNIFRRDRGVLGGLPVPDYEVSHAEDPFSDAISQSEDEEFDAADWVYEFEAEDEDEDGSEYQEEVGDRPKIPDPRSAFALAARLRRSRTQWGKVDVLAKEAGSIAKKIEEFAQGFDFLQRMGVLARAVEGYETANDSDRPKLRTMLKLEVARIRRDEGIKTIQRLLEELATFRDAGGNPGHLFQRSFMQALIPHWVTWTGEKPRRDNREFIEFVQAAYFVISAREFEGWANLMTTALEAYEKTSQANP